MTNYQEAERQELRRRRAAGEDVCRLECICSELDDVNPADDIGKSILREQDAIRLERWSAE